jgi:hypothetical protein
MTIVCSSLVIGAVNQMVFEQSGGFLTHLGVIPEGCTRTSGEPCRRLSGQLGVASVRCERVDLEGTEANGGQEPYWVAGHRPDGADDRSDPAVGPKAVPEDRTFEILREHR